MRAAKATLAAGIAALLASTLAAHADAQSRRPPIVRVYSENGPDVISTSTYVTPAIEVSENAYVFAVAMDLDGQIRVLHPDFPGISVKLAAHRPVRLPNFFAGFNQSEAGGYYSSASYLDDGYLDSRGTVIALASRAPFSLERIESDGDWNMAAIRRLIERRTPENAAQALAAYLGAKGEPIGRDFMRFAGGQRYASDGYGYGYNGYSACDSYYGYGFGLLRQVQVFRYISYLNAHGVKYRIGGYDLCGLPIVVPSNGMGGGAVGFPVTRPPRRQGDTTVFPKSRAPNTEPRRFPHEASAEAALPMPRRAGLPQMGDVTITPPANRRGEPRTIIDGYRPSPGGMTIPQGRAPIEGTVAPRTAPAASGAQPTPQYRPEPRVETPPPSRMPEAPRPSSPPPTVHSAPVSSPPPRAEAPTTRTEPARVPPPSRR